MRYTGNVTTIIERWQAVGDLIITGQGDREIPSLLPPSDDGIFKAMLTHPDAVTVLPDLLSEFLGINVTSVELRNTEPPISDALEKQERFDANCDFEDAEGKGQADVEMQAGRCGAYTSHTPISLSIQK
jgi:hypothetical protein